MGFLLGGVVLERSRADQEGIDWTLIIKPRVLFSDHLGLAVLELPLLEGGNQMYGTSTTLSRR